MLKHMMIYHYGENGLITVQDNTMLKLGKLFNFKVFCLITVQDNTMLKHAERLHGLFNRLITVQDNTMLKPQTSNLKPQTSNLKFKHLCAQPAEIPNDISYYPTFIISPLSFLHNYFA